LTATAYAISAVVSGGNRITNDGTAVKITANNTCQTVKNNGTLGDIFVPTNTLNEWNIFTSNKPAYVDLGVCCTPDSITQTLNCASPQTGKYTQTRTSVCPVGAVTPVNTPWVTTVNNCVSPTVIIQNNGANPGKSCVQKCQERSKNCISVGTDSDASNGALRYDESFAQNCGTPRDSGIEGSRSGPTRTGCNMQMWNNTAYAAPNAVCAGRQTFWTNCKCQ